MEMDHFTNVQSRKILDGIAHSEINSIIVPEFSIVLTSRMTPFGVILRTEIPKNAINAYQNIGSIVFEIHLEGKYPYQPPKILCETIFSYPSISDGRDLLAEILETSWSPKVKISDLIKKIPKFVEKLSKTNILRHLNIGKFHLGHPMHLTSWALKENMAYFICHEIDLKLPIIKHERIIVITHTRILILSVSKDFLGVGHLISWASLDSIYTIIRSRSQENKVVIQWKKVARERQISQQFLIDQASEFVTLVCSNIRKLGDLYNKNLENELESDEINLNEGNSKILEEISKYESMFESINKIETVDSLMVLYQKAIEYYSLKDEAMYQKLIQRMHLFLSKKNIMKMFEKRKKLEEGKNMENLEDEKEKLI
ncbi:unnamed protein product [Blepharisma stoltei]|uniref:UBC core domain-containing protein n=1 Tax=Blepharisma stoltei TaxID=1481888 RepID=A0AAU9KE46_9CILI|nr:unnamed protein product [Blepharisma stoltei]